MSASHTIYECFKMSIDDRAVTEMTPVSEAIEKMRATHQNCLLVRDREGHGAGVISEHDIVSAFAKNGGQAGKMPVELFMTVDVVVIREFHTIEDAIKLMSKHNIRHIPVVSESGYVRGFLSIMELVTKKMELEALESSVPA